jgi:hypothetical protein
VPQAKVNNNQSNAYSAEERLFTSTNYFHELTNFYPNTEFKLHFVGPELSPGIHLKSHTHSERLSGTFYRGPVSEFLLEQTLPAESTLFIGYNPGYGSGYDLLLNSWALDLAQLLNLGHPICFTQANDYSDQRGELKVLETLFEGKVKFLIEPHENPFRAVTYYHEEGKKETSWSCSNTHLYVIQGWKEASWEGDKMSAR